MTVEREFVTRCPIHGSIVFNQKEKQIIDHPYFQRLRWISQLGFVFYVYTSAVHTRFTHSLGAMHLAGRIFDQLVSTKSLSLRDFFSSEDLSYFRQIVRLTALVHDLGHPPFSHSLESILPVVSNLSYRANTSENRATHEDFSIAMVYALSEGKNAPISGEERDDIIAILCGVLPKESKLNRKKHSVRIFPLLCQMISGELDVDRMDYLLRDAYFAGVTYGNFDLNRIVQSLGCFFDKTSNNLLLCIDVEAIPAYDNFLLARFNMFVQVYYHKSLAAFNYYLEHTFLEKEIDLVIPDDLEDYARLTENLVWEKLFQAGHQKWSQKITQRIPAKTIIRRVGSNEKFRNQVQNIANCLRREGIEMIVSRAENSFSIQKNKSVINQETLMASVEEFGKIRSYPITQISPLLKRAEEKIEINQLYVHLEDFEKVINILQTKGF